MRRTTRLRSTGYLHPNTGDRFAAQIAPSTRAARDLTGIDFAAVLEQVVYRGVSQTGRDKHRSLTSRVGGSEAVKQAGVQALLGSDGILFRWVGARKSRPTRYTPRMEIRDEGIMGRRVSRADYRRYCQQYDTRNT